jgi:glycosyltransferase involved in cell wall biosynthesis
MKIAHIVSLNESVPPKSRGGLEFLVSWLTEELVKRGHEVTLFAPATSETSANLSPLVLEPLNRKAKSQWEKTFFSIWNSMSAGIRAAEFDIIHGHNGNGAYIAPFVNIPIIETLHGVYEPGFFANYFTDNKKQEEMVTPIIKQYEKINYVAVSKKQEELYRVCEPYYFKKYTTIHNGIPVQNFSFNSKPKDYLLYLGYINEEKGADIAVQVALRAGKKLILAGDNYGTESFFKEKIEPFLSENIQYVGPVQFEKKNELYKNAQALLAPLRWDEPFGLTLVEAQACGTPVIALNKGAAKEVVCEGKTGFVVENEEEMINAIKQISTINRADCRKWVEDNFSVEKMVDKYEELYKKLLKK